MYLHVKTTFMLWECIIVLIIIVLYVRTYYKYPAKTLILQTSIDQFAFDALLEKQPLVIDDKTVDAKDFQGAWFKFNPSSSFTLGCSEKWYRNRYKYNIIQVPRDATDKIEVYLCNPRTKTESDGSPIQEIQEASDTEKITKIVAVQLSPLQMVVVPLHWHYMISCSNDQTVDCIGLHDAVTYLLQ